MSITQNLKKKMLEIVIQMQQDNYFDLNFDIKKLNFVLAEPNLSQKNNSAVVYDLSSNLAFVLKTYKKINPIQIAQDISNKLATYKLIKQIDVTTPGFLNIILDDSAFIEIISNINSQKQNYAKNISEKRKINVEYVSANPTGFLHVGHVRGAVFGSSLVNVYKHVGYDVEAEYYINDAGNQIEVLANSLWVRYKNLYSEEKVEMPEESYQGEDIIWAAQELYKLYKDEFLTLNKTKKIKLKNIAIEIFLNKIKNDLAKLNVYFDTFSSEKVVLQSDLINKVLVQLNQHTYQKDGALFLKTTTFGDDKDRVLIKNDANNTYLLPDIAYHLTKLQKADYLVNIWGADHSGYVARMKIALQALGYNADKLEVLIIQLVRLIKDGVEFKMSKRAGTSITLSDLLNVVSADIIRFMMLTRDISNKFDFDIDFVNSNDSNNPVYIVQYGYSRTLSLLKKLTTPQLQKNIIFSNKAKKIIISLDLFIDLLKTIVDSAKVNLLSQYLLNLVKLFNSFYEETRLQGHEFESSYAAMVLAVKYVMKLALDLMGINAPETM
ncbi:arginyl-tRNA synthetase [Mycoplasmopsis mustelae]|uniref:Arginine--tRNA ligase n=1 Tax=Mycoplasmopsis mustelae TaxID=171289 RepID=A0A4V3FNX1_9BACT|nr:arginine--tRNA ligase [Mycoplasmopsis mustelae]TDV24070.1 arginyl-tRNA synthetase [Mycoplasmopsis mustelae]